MVQSASSREAKYQIMPELLLMVLQSGEPIEVNSFFFSHDFMWSIDRCQLFRWIFPKSFFWNNANKNRRKCQTKTQEVGSPTRTHGILTTSPSGSWPMHIWKSQLWPRKSRCWTAWRRIWSRCRWGVFFFFVMSWCGPFAVVFKSSLWLPWYLIPWYDIL